MEDERYGEFEGPATIEPSGNVSFSQVSRTGHLVHFERSEVITTSTLENL